MSVSCHFLLQAPQCPCSVRKRFSRNHCFRGRSKPGCRIVGLHTRCELTTSANFQLCLHQLLMSTGCKSKTDAHKIDAIDQWCLRMLLGIKWYQFVRNDDVRRLTKQPKLNAIIQSCRLTLFGHIIAHGRQRRCQEDPVSLPSGRLEKTTSRPRNGPHHVAQHRPTGSEQHHLMLPEAADLAQNCPLWRMMSTYGAM